MHITTLGLIWQSMCSSYTDAIWCRPTFILVRIFPAGHPTWPMVFSTTSESYCFS